MGVAVFDWDPRADRPTDSPVLLTKGVILTTVSSAGIVGNALSIVVLFSVSIRGSFSHLLRYVSMQIGFH